MKNCVNPNLAVAGNKEQPKEQENKADHVDLIEGENNEEDNPNQPEEAIDVQNSPKSPTSNTKDADVEAEKENPTPKNTPDQSLQHEVEVNQHVPGKQASTPANFPSTGISKSHLETNADAFLPKSSR